MKAAVTYEVLYFLEDLLISKCLILEIYGNYIFKQFTKWCFSLCFYNVIKVMGKRK